MRRAAVVALVLVMFGVAAGGFYVVWKHRPAGVFALKERDAPDPACVFLVQLDRESMAKQPVQFGDLNCGGPVKPVLRIGARWFTLPSTAAQSRYGTVRRTESNLHWVVAADTDFFRSDDGGDTFRLLHLPGWGDDVAHVTELSIKGLSLEHIAFAYDVKLALPRRLWAAFDDAAPTTAAERWQLMKAAWDDTAWMLVPPHLRWESHDGGKTWTK